MKAWNALRGLAGLRRAWPGRHGEIIFEAWDRYGRLRAGSIGADGDYRFTSYATDEALPELIPPDEGTLVVHRLHRRAVVIQADRVLKYVRPGKADKIAAASLHVGRLLEGAGFGSAQILAVTPSRIEFSFLPGRTLYEWGEEGIGAWTRFVDCWPEVARRDIDLPAHTSVEEVDVLLRWFSHAERFGVISELTNIQRAVEHTCQELTADTQDYVMLHRDLYDKQILWDGEQISILDLDTASRGEAAVDVGNLIAHAELRRVQGTLSVEVFEQVLAQVDRLASLLRVRQSRVECYTQAARLRLAFVYAFRPTADKWIEDWIETCLRSS